MDQLQLDQDMHLLNWLQYFLLAHSTHILYNLLCLVETRKYQLVDFVELTKLFDQIVLDHCYLKIFHRQSDNTVTVGQTLKSADFTSLLSQIKSSVDIIFVDGVYLMIDEVTGEANTPMALTNITRSMKRLAQKHKKPIVMTTQVLTHKMRRGQVTADAIGYSSSFYQDSDVIFALQRQDENDDSSRLLRIVASRNCGPAEVELLWDWEEGRFEEYGSGVSV